MCPQVINNMCSLSCVPKKTGFINCPVMPLLLFIFIFSLAFGTAFAQNKSEEYLEVKTWKEPKNAVPFKELVLQDSIYLYKDKPFTGVAIERYPNGFLQRAATFVKGKQQGPMLMWYPDGSPQMSANYVNGYLQGRFLGWYNNGSVIYDLMINRGTYAGDNLFDEDASRASSEIEDREGESPDNDQSQE